MLCPTVFVILLWSSVVALESGNNFLGGSVSFTLDHSADLSTTVGITHNSNANHV